MPPKKLVKATKPVKDIKPVNAPNQERLNIDLDISALVGNITAAARKNPAGVVVGAMAILLAILLVFG